MSLLIRGSDANLQKQSSSDDKSLTQSNIVDEGQRQSNIVNEGHQQSSIDDEGQRQSRIHNVKSNDNSLVDNRMASAEAESAPQVADLRVRGVSTRSRAKKEKRSEEDTCMLNRKH